MQSARRRRAAWIIAGSAMAHAVVLTVVALQRPTLFIPQESAGPPEPIIPVLLMPRTPPPPNGHGVRPAPIQLHRRAPREAANPTPIAPLVIPQVKAPPVAPPPTGPVTARETAPLAPPPGDAVRATLRATLGCTEARLAGLSREERQGCLDRLARGARDAPYLGSGLPAEKRALLQDAADAKLAQKVAAERAAPTARLAPPPADYDGEPDTSGAGQSAYGPIEHKASKRAARVLPRLPP
jgi:hypothetical protein